MSAFRSLLSSRTAMFAVTGFVVGALVTKVARNAFEYFYGENEDSSSLVQPQRETTSEVGFEVVPSFLRDDDPSSVLKGEKTDSSSRRTARESSVVHKYSKDSLTEITSSPGASAEDLSYKKMKIAVVAEEAFTPNTAELLVASDDLFEEKCDDKSGISDQGDGFLQMCFENPETVATLVSHDPETPSPPSVSSSLVDPQGDFESQGILENGAETSLASATGGDSTFFTDEEDMNLSDQEDDLQLSLDGSDTNVLVSPKESFRERELEASVSQQELGEESQTSDSSDESDDSVPLNSEDAINWSDTEFLDLPSFHQSEEKCEDKSGISDQGDSFLQMCFENPETDATLVSHDPETPSESSLLSGGSSYSEFVDSGEVSSTLSDNQMSFESDAENTNEELLEEVKPESSISDEEDESVLPVLDEESELFTPETSISDSDDRWLDRCRKHLLESSSFHESDPNHVQSYLEMLKELRYTFLSKLSQQELGEESQTSDSSDESDDSVSLNSEDAINWSDTAFLDLPSFHQSEEKSLWASKDKSKDVSGVSRASEPSSKTVSRCGRPTKRVKWADEVGFSLTAVEYCWNNNAVSFLSGKKQERYPKNVKSEALDEMSSDSNEETSDDETSDFSEDELGGDEDEKSPASEERDAKSSLNSLGEEDAPRSLSSRTWDHPQDPAWHQQENKDGCTMRDQTSATAEENSGGNKARATTLNTLLPGRETGSESSHTRGRKTSVTSGKTLKGIRLKWSMFKKKIKSKFQ